MTEPGEREILPAEETKQNLIKAQQDLADCRRDLEVLRDSVGRIQDVSGTQTVRVDLPAGRFTLNAQELDKRITKLIDKETQFLAEVARLEGHADAYETVTDYFSGKHDNSE